MNRTIILLCGILILSVIFPLKISNAQTCGFGCFGLSGFYGGYTYQKYNADGLNSYIQSVQYVQSYSDSPFRLMKNFKDAKGIRVGANLFRFHYKDFLVSIKGSYQFLESEQSVSEEIGQSVNTLSTILKLNYWGIGVDFGYSVFSFLDLKFADVQITFHSAKLNINSKISDVQNEVEYKTDKASAGYFIGSGFIINLVKDYLSIEATAGYTNFKINDLKDDENNSVSFGANGTDFIKSGGLTVIGQINVGFPLY